MPSRTINYYNDHEVIERESFVIVTEYITSYSDVYKTYVNTETLKYSNEYSEHNDGFTYFNLFKKEENGSKTFLTQYQTISGTVITPEIADRLGDYYCKIVLKYGVPIGESIPCIYSGVCVKPLGLTLINPSIKKLYIDADEW